MTQPATDTLERESFLVNDKELLERLGVPERTGRIALKALDKDKRSGFPPKQKLWGNRRWWPAVEAYFRAHSGMMKTGAAGLITHDRDHTRPPRPHHPVEPRGGQSQ